MLCGWLAVHRAAGVATPEVDATVRALAATTTLLSATLLDCAMHGEVIPEFAAWLAALGTDDEEPRADGAGPRSVTRRAAACSRVPAALLHDLERVAA